MDHEKQASVHMHKNWNWQIRRSQLCVSESLNYAILRGEKNIDLVFQRQLIKDIQRGFIAKLLQYWPPFNHLHNLHSYIPALLPGTQLLIEFIVRQATHLSFVKKTYRLWKLGVCVGTVVEKYMAQSCPYILVNKAPLLTLSFGICAIYFGLKVILEG